MKIEGKYTTATFYGENFEEECIRQVERMTNHEAFTNPIAIMPDAHFGKGSCVGFTMKLGDKVVPNVVGVDIGCGMEAWNLGVIENLNLQAADYAIRNRIPMGFNSRSEVYHEATRQACALGELVGTRNVNEQVGTLGGGNHFIELGQDAAGNTWVIVHSGSRNLGAKTCAYYQGLTGTKDELGYLEGSLRDEYINAMDIAQDYALLNRISMCEIVAGVVGKGEVFERITSIHNYIDPQDEVIRKGACGARTGECFVVPINMRDGVLVCEGKGNSEWNWSAPHGAGRRLSRTKAKKEIVLQDFEEQMKGIYSTSITKSTLDEAPDAYKNAEYIKKWITGTGNIVNIIKPILNIKAA